MRDTVYVVGHGKLASRIERDLSKTGERLHSPFTLVVNWDSTPRTEDPSRTVLVHCGSGRQLPEALACCHANRVPLIQCATGVTYPTAFASELPFALVEAPNLSISMIKFLYLLEEMGPLFREYDISITESHQSTKTSPPGTALEIARLLGVEESRIRSVRNEDIQRRSLGVPKEYLGQHAVHVIEIQDGAAS